MRRVRFRGPGEQAEAESSRGGNAKFCLGLGTRCWVQQGAHAAPGRRRQPPRRLPRPIAPRLQGFTQVTEEFDAAATHRTRARYPGRRGGGANDSCDRACQSSDWSWAAVGRRHPHSPCAWVPADGTHSIACPCPSCAQHGRQGEGPQNAERAGGAGSQGGGASLHDGAAKPRPGRLRGHRPGAARAREAWVRANWAGGVGVLTRRPSPFHHVQAQARALPVVFGVDPGVGTVLRALWFKFLSQSQLLSPDYTE